MKPLVPKIKETIEKSEKLRQQKLSKYKTSLDHIAIFCRTANEYDQYNEEANHLGRILREQDKGITYALDSPIDTVGGEISLVKIVKPNKNNKVHGAVDYSVEEYPNVKDTLVNNKTAEIKKASDGVELLEIKNQDVILFIPEIPLGSEIEKIINKNAKQNSNNNLKNQIEIEKEKRLRLMADFENYKKRIEKEKSTFGALANLGIISEILEINDDLGLALDDSDLNLERAKDSINNAKEKLKSTAMNAGIETLEINVGDEFDKEKMEAVQATPNPDMKNKVIAVISSAFKFKDKDGILKPAKVIIGK